MQFEILQEEHDKRNILNMFTKFIEKNGVKTQEQLEQRFNCLAVDFCIKNNGVFSPDKKIMSFTRLKKITVS